MNVLTYSKRPLIVALCILAFGRLAAQPAIPSPEPIVQWSFETLKDGVIVGSGSYGRTGDVIGTATLAPGLVGNAISFQGDPIGRLIIPLDLNAAITGPFTLSLWVHPTGKVKGYGVLFDAGGSRGLVLRTNAANRISFSINRQWNVILTETKLTQGKWAHLALTLDGKIARVYIDGLEAGFFAYSQAPQFPKEVQVGAVEELLTGATAPTIINGFVGEIDEMKIYDQVLTSAQLNSLASLKQGSN